MTTISFEEQARRFKLLGHSVRLQILDILRRDPECVCHLEAVLNRSQPYISQQLRILREADVVNDQKDGLNVYYHLVDPGVAALLDSALGPVQPDTRDKRTIAPGCSCPHCVAPAYEILNI